MKPAPFSELRAIASYVVASEERHYEESDRAPDHIYAKAIAVRDWADDCEKQVQLGNSADPAAIMDIVTSLNDAAERAQTNLSEAYQGFDQFMREVMRCATEFETWAAAHVEFEELDGTWPYDVGGHFMKGAKAVLGTEHADDILLNLEKLDAAAWPKIAEAAGLPIVDGPAIEKPWMVQTMIAARWNDAEWTEDQGGGAKPLRFATKEGAEAAIREHVDTLNRAHIGTRPPPGFRISDYRAVLDPKLRNELKETPLPVAHSPSPKSGPKV
jgi:hypothetical protein